MIEDEDQLHRTRAWAARFRSAATECRAAPPPDQVGPILWKAQIDSYEAQAATLDAEIAEYERTHPSDARQ